MAESIVKAFRDKDMDYDFIAFSFKGKNSYDDFGIYRTSDGDRYNTDMAPDVKEVTAEVPGGDGMYYFGSTYSQRQFPVNFAFDHLTEDQFMEMKEWLNTKDMGDLWFSEEPYKVYTAKPTGKVTLKTLCFEETYMDGSTEKVRRIYKGEGSVTFIAYWPFAHTPDYVTDAGLLYIEEREDVFYADGRLVARDIFSKQTFKKNKKYTIMFENLGLTFPVSETGETIEVNEPGVSIILYTATHLRQQNTTLNKNVWVPPREGKTSGFVFNNDYKGKNYYTFSCDEDFIINFAGRWYEGNKSEKYTIKYKYALYEGEIEPESFPVKKDAKNFDNWVDFGNRNQWKDSSNIQSQTKTAVGENYGHIPTPFVLKISTINDDLKFVIGNSYLIINGKDKNYSDIIWDSKTGLVSAKDGNGNRYNIPYEGDSIDAIDPGTIRVMKVYKKTGGNFGEYLTSTVATTDDNKWYFSGTGTAPSPLICPILEYHYWYY